MKKIVLFGGIGLVLVVVLAVWVLTAGFGFLWERFPRWISGAEKIAGVAIEKGKEALPVITEKAKEVSPQVTEKIMGLVPGEEMPEKDVGGEDINGTPRFQNMVRASFVMQDGKRTIVYKGKAEFNHVIDFYNKEMPARGFKKKVLSASAHEEVHEYRKAKRALEFSFKKTDRFGFATTEMVIREL